MEIELLELNNGQKAADRSLAIAEVEVDDNLCAYKAKNGDAKSGIEPCMLANKVLAKFMDGLIQTLLARIFKPVAEFPRTSVDHLSCPAGNIFCKLSFFLLLAIPLPTSIKRPETSLSLL